MKKIFFPLIFIALPAALSAATGATQLEGSFKVGPSIILITILCLFVLVGIDIGSLDGLWGRREGPVFLQQGIGGNAFAFLSHVVCL